MTTLLINRLIML